MFGFICQAVIAVCCTAGGSPWLGLLALAGGVFYLLPDHFDDDDCEDGSDE